MTYTKDTFRRLFQSKFNLSQWQMLLRDYFHADKIRTSPESLEEDAEDREGYYLGNMTTTDNFNLGFFFYEMKDVSVLRRKVGLRNLVKPYLRYGIDAALAVFTDGKFWRLSLVCDLAEEATNTKRFTYVFGDEKAFYKTPIQRFNGLQKNADSFQAIKNAFSVEALSDDFFEEYRNQYAEFIKFLTGKKYVKKGNKWVEETIGEPNTQFFSSFGGDKKMVRDYVKKMMGRIVFLYFLQSKGWLAGNYHYMHDLFSGSEHQNDFLDKVLEPMFFGLLNTKPEDRSTAPLVNGVGVKYIPNADQIPYLNGGLFQQEKIDEVDSRFPANMFQSLFDFFDSYNFTIDENDPNDAEVGVDPEMLGKIFENLLEDNKDKGAFYTPKEIVRYMCQESLIAYLQTHESDEAVKQHIANFVKTYNVEELGGASSELAASIDQRLKDVKICDPAIGSGAFPMGLLRELYACRKAIEIFDADNAADIKRHIIQNNIYGVDIEKGAVDIARLRFWLALIIDEKEPMPLPNLDFKIMQGNSLLESYKGVDLSQIQNEVKRGEVVRIKGRRSKKMIESKTELSFVFDEKDAQKNIQDLMKMYFDITDHVERDKCRNQINGYIKEYIKKCAEGNDEIIESVYSLDIPNDQFFLWHIYFADVFEQGGFDIVIGNPPYIQLQNNGGELASLYQNQNFDTFVRTGDIYCLFYESGWDILKKAGVLCYITSNKWMRAGYGEKTREFFAKYTNPKLLVDFAGIKIFDSATVDTNVLLFSKDDNERHTLCAVTSKQSKDCIKNLSDFVKQEGSINAFSGTDAWVILSPIEQSIKRKIEAVGIPLKDWDICIYRGILTGCNEAFIISTEKRDEILANCQSEDERRRTEELIRPILRGRDIKRYGYDWASLWLIATFPSCHYDIEKYPAVKKYLLSFGIERLEQTGQSHIINGQTIKSRKKTNNKWFETQDSISYWEDFLKPKIVWGEISDRSKFAYERDGVCVPEATTFLMTGKKLPYLLCVLNSPLAEWFFSKVGTTTGVGTVRWKKYTILELLIPMPSKMLLNIIEELVDNYVNGRIDREILQKQANNYIYKEVGLDEKEIEYAESYYPPLL